MALKQSRGRGWALRVAGFAAVVVVLVGLMSGMAFAGHLVGGNDVIAGVGGGLAALVPLVGRRALRGAQDRGRMPQDRGRRHLAPSAEAAMTRDPRPPVLYLRSFQHDTVGSRIAGPGTLLGRALTEEEQLAEALNAIGPFIAVGRPGDELPALGAARLYVDDEEWQQKVSALMARAGLVVLRVGDTAGFWWEVERAIEVVPRKRLLFLLPSGQRYQTFRERAARDLRLQLPILPEGGQRGPGRSLARTLLIGKEQLVLPEGSIHAAVYFDATEEPHTVVFDRARLDQMGRRATYHMFRRHLWPLLPQLGGRSAGHHYDRVYLNKKVRMVMSTSFTAGGFSLILWSMTLIW